MPKIPRPNQMPTHRAAEAQVVVSPEEEVLISLPGDEQAQTSPITKRRAVDRNSQALIHGPLVPGPDSRCHGFRGFSEAHGRTSSAAGAAPRVPSRHASTATVAAASGRDRCRAREQEIQKRIADARARIAELSNKDKTAASIPKNAELRAFKLQYVRPGEIGQALRSIAGPNGPRIAIDERTNALVVAGNDQQISVAEQLVETLDRPGKAADSKGSRTLQVRVVWSCSMG